MQRIIGLIAVVTSISWIILGSSGIAFFGLMWTGEVLLEVGYTRISSMNLPDIPLYDEQGRLREWWHRITRGLALIRIPGMLLSLLFTASQVPTLYLGKALLRRELTVGRDGGEQSPRGYSRPHAPSKR